MAVAAAVPLATLSFGNAVGDADAVNSSVNSPSVLLLPAIDVRF